MVKQTKPQKKEKKDVEKKPPAVEPETEKKAEVSALASKKYIFAVGRRKNAVATVRLYPDGKGEIVVNKKKIPEYFPYFEFQNIILAPFSLAGTANKFDAIIHVQGGGMRGQAEAIRLGISRCLLKFDEIFRKSLRPAGFLTRDSRIKERKKPGLKRARRAPQWAKR